MEELLRLIPLYDAHACRKLSKLHPRRAETYARLAVYEQPPVDLKDIPKKKQKKISAPKNPKNKESTLSELCAVRR